MKLFQHIQATQTLCQSMTVYITQEKKCYFCLLSYICFLKESSNKALKTWEKITNQ